MAASLGLLDRIGFRGDRDYLHGTDLFNHFVERVGIGGPLSARFHQAIRSVPELFELAPEDAGEGWPTLFITGSDPECRTFGLAETGAAPGHRFAYDEPEVVAAAALDRDSAAIADPPRGDYSFIERAVALQKKLLDEVLAADVKWWFVRLDVERIPPKVAGRLDLRLVQNLGIRIVKSEIREDGKVLGDIYFSGERP